MEIFIHFWILTIPDHLCNYNVINFLLDCHENDVNRNQSGYCNKS